MTSELKVDKITPASGTNTQIGEAGDTTNLSAGTVTLPTSIITGATEKTSLVDADKFLIADSADSNAFKHVQKSNMPSGDWILISTTENMSDGGVAALSVDNVFSSTYVTYRVIAQYRSSSGGVSPYWRWLNGGSAVTASNYRYTCGRAQINSSNATEFLIDHSGWDDSKFQLGNNLSANNNSGNNQLDFTIFDPYKQKVTRTHIFGNKHYYRDDSIIRVGTFVGYYAADDSTTYEGFQLYMSSGNIENYSISVYGLVR